MTSILTNSGINILMNRSFKATPDYTAPTKLRVGSSQEDPVATDTDLTLPIPFGGTEAVDACDVITGWSASADASAVSLDTSSYKEGTASLKMGKSGSTVANISYSKAVTSLDFTSKQLFGWIYVTTIAELISTGTAISVRYGSDASNYYQKDYAIGDLAAGWNIVSFTSATATSTTGIPVITAMDYLYIQFFTDLTSDTIASGNLKTDDWKLSSSDDFIRTIDSATINETSRSVVIEGTVLATEANGFNITGYAFVNTDTTPLPLSIVKVTAVSKNSNEELTASQKIRYRRTTGG